MIISLIVLFLAACALCFWLGTEVSGQRWSEQAFMNGRRMFFHGKSYEIRELPLKPTEMDN